VIRIIWQIQYLWRYTWQWLYTTRTVYNKDFSNLCHMHKYMHRCTKCDIKRPHWKQGKMLCSAKEKNTGSKRNENDAACLLGPQFQFSTLSFRGCHAHRSWKSETRFARFTVVFHIDFSRWTTTTTAMRQSKRAYVGQWLGWNPRQLTWFIAYQPSHFPTSLLA